MKQPLILSLLLLLLSSCDLVQYHPYEMVESGPKNLTAHNISLIEELARGKDTLRFLFITDTQRNYDDTQSAVNYINSRSDIDFVLHGGDLTDFGLADEFDWMTNILCKMRPPFLTVIGNHDFLGVGEHNYSRIYGAYNWSLNAGHTHIVGLNTNAREQEYALPVPDFTFISDDINQVREINTQHPDSLTHTILLMHSRPGDEQFNNNVKALFKGYIRQYPGLTAGSAVISEDIASSSYPQDSEQIMGSLAFGFALNGHNHRHELLRLFDDELLFYGSPNIKEREGFLFTIHPKGYSYESICF